MHELTTMTEKELREYKVGFPKSKEELDEILNALIERQHDYGTCVYAASISAVATMNFVASKLGMTGFQFSYADMDVLRRTRGMERFQIVNYADHLFPQYDLVGRLQKSLDEQKEWFAEEAQKNLDEQNKEFPAHPDVVAHWEKLANG